MYDEPVRGVVESMNGARLIPDELVKHGWDVLVADAQKVKGLAPLACKTDSGCHEHLRRDAEVDACAEPGTHRRALGRENLNAADRVRKPIHQRARCPSEADRRGD